MFRPPDIRHCPPVATRNAIRAAAPRLPPLSISYLPSPRLAASHAFYFRVWRRGRESARARVYSEGKRIPPNVGRESGRRGFYTLADGGDSPRAKMRLFSARSFRFPLTNKL